MSWVQHNHTPSQEGNQDDLTTAFFPTNPFSFHVSSYHHEQAEEDRIYYCGGSSNPLPNIAPLPTSTHHEEMARPPKKTGVVARKPRRNPQAMPQQYANSSGCSASSCNSSNEILKACSDCHTTKTPLWRSGPQGPRSVCNACGIRRRKARKAMASAAVAAAATATFQGEQPICGNDQYSTPALIVNTIPKVVEDDRHASSINTMPFKKRCHSFATTASIDGKHDEGKDLIATSTVLHSHNSNHSKVFPQEEKEAAILLMALSCGLTCR